MINLTTSIPSGPGQSLVRHAVANDAAASGGMLADTLTSRDGAVFHGFEFGNLSVVPRSGPLVTDAPGGTSTAVVTVYEWNAPAERFVATGDTWTASGAGVAFARTFDARGRRLRFHMSGVSADESVSVYSSGFRADGT